MEDANASGRRSDESYALDVSALPPLYQQIYEKVLAQRLRLAGLEDSASVARAEGRLIISAPRDMLREREPSVVAHRHLEAGDAAWVHGVDRDWRQAARHLEEQAAQCWVGLCQGRASVEQLHSLVSAKILLNAFAVDTLLPPATVVRAWLAPHVDSDILDELVDACYLPASGYVAYDDFEDACWKLAASLATNGYVSEEARGVFIRHGLFLLYHALDTCHWPYYFDDYPRELAAQYSRLAAGRSDIEGHRNAIGERSRRRRLHRWWGREQIARITDCATRRQLLAVHALLGSGRDFDEEKRRLNSNLWRYLGALADGLGVSLRGPEGNLEGLSSALAARQGSITIDPIFLDEP